VSIHARVKGDARRWWAPLCALLLLVAFAVACATSEKQTYLALGDSYAVGEGASQEGKTAYVPLFYAFLEGDMGKQLSLRNLAGGGETSASIIADGQLAKALAELKFRNQDGNPGNDVVVITIDIGGNDLRDLALPGQPCAPPAAITDPSCTTALSKTMDDLSQNLDASLRALRVAAGPDTRMFVLDYFNPYSGTGEALEAAGDVGVPILNDKIAEIATRPGIDAQVVETFDAFEGKGEELTHLADPDANFHPNDAGYRLLADLLIAAYEH
jgi:lysophospholipase L1-like esterase